MDKRKWSTRLKATMAALTAISLMVAIVSVTVDIIGIWVKIRFAEKQIAIEIVDRDSDGYSADIDCDDNDPKTNPGRSEICDGKDNDCDKAKDENKVCDEYAGSGYPFGEDKDKDGYPPGSDCDDNDPNTNPGKHEIRDNKDNDCDGAVDENT